MTKIDLCDKNIFVREKIIFAPTLFFFFYFFLLFQFFLKKDSRIPPHTEHPNTEPPIPFHTHQKQLQQ